MKLKAWILALLASPIFSLQAQVHTDVLLGNGVSYIQQRNMNRKFEPIVRPNSTLNISIPVTKRIALQTGMGYCIKGYSIYEHINYTGGRMEFKATDRMHYLSIPLLASFKTFNSDNTELWIDAGMNYDIFLTGNLTYDFKTYTGSNLESQQTINYTIKGRIDQSKFGATENNYDVDALDVCVKLQLRLIVGKKLTIAAYHTHSLYDNRANPDDNKVTSFKYRYTGLSVGWRLF